MCCRKQIVVALACLAFAGVAAGDAAFTWGGREKHPAVVNPVLGENAAEVISLRGEWEFTTEGRNVPIRNGIWGFFPEKKWKKARTIQVPGNWEAQGVGEPGEGECWDPVWDNNAKPIRHKYMGEGWYRKTVKIPQAWSGRRVWIKMGGVKSVGWVWVNGKQVALIDDYCGTFKYEITDLVEFGKDAQIVVDVDNRKPSRKGLMSAMHKWGGIYRDVELEATPQTFIDDVWVRGDFDARTAEVHVTIDGAPETWKSGTLRVEIDGAQGQIAATGGRNVVRLPLANFRPWSPEHPNLYTARVDLVENGQVVQTRRERFGVRKLEVVGKEFRLNGKPFFMRGFGDDHVYPLTGMTVPDRDVHRAHLAKARAAGFNYVRLHTHCEVPEYFEAADELGILIQAELPYYSDVPAEGFAFDPKRDATELHEHYRRHPSFGSYSLGNEGSFGEKLDVALHRYIKAMDPDRLKINQDLPHSATNLFASNRSDYDGGPIRMWPRGSYAPERPFVCHEYLNLCVKTDSRTEGKYTGVWQPPVTRAKRAEWLAGFGLDHDWGDRLQDAQHALQGVWQKRGIESARADEHCGGYHFWTIVDVVVWNDKVKTYSAQGLFNPFWEDKPCGFSASEFATFNSPSCVLADFRPERAVFASGESLTADVLFAHFGDAPVEQGLLEWQMVVANGDTKGKTLAAGKVDVGPQQLGPARKVATVDVGVPEVPRPTKVLFVVTIADAQGKNWQQSNQWPLWIFPKGPSRAEIVAAAAAHGVTIAAKDSPAAKAALAKGEKLISIAGAKGKDNVNLGWWWMGDQVGTAIKSHPALGDFPHEGVMTPLWFRLIKDKGLPLPTKDAKDLIVVGEGGTQCFAYLFTQQVGKSKVIACHGLDLESGTPEGNALLRNLVSWLEGE